jgi:hypothetical protein
VSVLCLLFNSLLELNVSGTEPDYVLNWKEDNSATQLKSCVTHHRERFRIDCSFVAIRFFRIKFLICNHLRLIAKWAKADISPVCHHAVRGDQSESCRTVSYLYKATDAGWLAGAEGV